MKATREEAATMLIQAVIAKPGMSTDDVVKAAKMRKQAGTDELKRLAAEGILRAEPGPKRSTRWFVGPRAQVVFPSLPSGNSEPIEDRQAVAPPASVYVAGVNSPNLGATPPRPPRQSGPSTAADRPPGGEDAR